ncbi:alpha/beta fold hydrolase [Sphingomonas aerophila]|uniref:Pimeloyl-ACP methyl ester carboxylesterase n=1 Tax=Sphingomonas aerophila TaxID=1344948 RepID=A0A7W9BDH1_9SPHN|nr:pimeloyl-ACP methyl ester carboxylesterase [Sphingomonas aerophila]
MRTAAKVGIAAGATLAGLSLFSTVLARRSEKLVPPDGRLVNVDGHPIHLIDRGEGPAIVMVHGLGGQMRNFNYGVVDALAERHRVVVIDRPGSGYSPPIVEGDAGISRQAALVAALIETLGLDQPMLVGHSYGGAVSMALALNDPGLVRGLALIAPLTQPIPALPAAIAAITHAPFPARLAFAAAVGSPFSQLNRNRVLAQVFAPEPVAPDFKTRGGGALSRRPGAIAAVAGDIANARTELTELAGRYRTLALPVSILFARGDKLLDPAEHGEKTAASITNGRCELVEGGHMLPVTQPELVTRFIAAAAG